MHHHTVQYLHWSEHQKAVEAEISLAAAASPAGLLAADHDLSVGNADPLRIIRGALRDHFLRLFRKCADLFFAQEPLLLRFFLCGFCFRQMVFDPAKVFSDEAFDLPDGAAKRRAHDHFSPADLHAQRPPTAPYDLVSNGMVHGFLNICAIFSPCFRKIQYF